jgi:lysophospholipase L1-like esterase
MASHLAEPPRGPAVAVVALVLVLVTWGLPGPAAAARGSLVALGDSFSSGEGLPPFAPGTDTTENTCRRAPHAWPRRLAARLELAAVSFACSGATTDHVARSDPGRRQRERRTAQLERLAGVLDASLVTITIGGNDLGFAGVLTRCVLARCDRPRRRGRAAELEDRRALDARLTRLRRILPGLYARLRAAAPHGKLVVVGYPRIFPRRPQATCDGITPAEGRLLNAETARLDAALRAAARRGQARYVGVLDALSGHELSCRPGGGWVTRLNLADPRSSFHPTLAGHARLAQVVGAALHGQRFGRPAPVG